MMSKVKRTIRKAGSYAWDYVKMSGLFPEFKKKPKKKGIAK